MALSANERALCLFLTAPGWLQDLQCNPTTGRCSVTGAELCAVGRHKQITEGVWCCFLLAIKKKKTFVSFLFLCLLFYFHPANCALSSVATAHTPTQFFLCFVVGYRPTDADIRAALCRSRASRFSHQSCFCFVLSILLISAAQTTCRPIARTPRTATHPQGRTGRLPLTPPPRATLPNTTSTPNPLPALGPWHRVQSPSPPAHLLPHFAGQASLLPPRPPCPPPPPPPHHLTSIQTPSPAACTSPSTARPGRSCMRPHQTQTLHLFTSKPHWC